MNQHLGEARTLYPSSWSKARRDQYVARQAMTGSGQGVSIINEPAVPDSEQAALNLKPIKATPFLLLGVGVVAVVGLVIWKVIR